MTQDQRWQIRFDEVMNFMEKEHRKPSKYYPKDIPYVLSVHLYYHGVILHNNECESYMESILSHPLISIHLVPDPLEIRNMIDYQSIYYKHLKCYLETILC